MTTVTLQVIDHRGCEQIAILAPNKSDLNLVIRKLPKVKWSQTHRCWYVPLHGDSPRMLRKSLEQLAEVDSKGIEEYLEKKKQIARTLPTPVELGKKKKTIQLIKNPAWKLSAPNLLELQKFVEQLKLKAYSASTIRTYRNEFLQLLQLLKKKPVNELDSEQLRRYMVYAMEKQKISENTAHSRINALKFYFEQVLGRDRFFWEIPRPKKREQLAKIFSQDEVAAIINSTSNRKHKAMLMLAYSAGLRVSEVISLKTYDIDSKRMTIFIRQSKGKKDRFVGLSPVLLVMLREYVKEYRPDRNGFLFEGGRNGVCYSVRSLQEVLQAAKKKAGILKPGSVHSLRHSFATHLVDRGTDVTMIQKLLGHNSIKTTLRYLHTTNKDLLKIISPLDDLKLQ